jgi:putative phage-type endonuclease
MYKLEYYNKKFKYLSEQGSDDWLEGRRFAFGGSEMAMVLDKDPYHTFSDMLERKLTKTFEEQDCTEWGKMFEPVAKLFIEKQKQTKIHEFGSIPHSYYPVCYSPDGILVDEKLDDLILLEIKSPIYRGVHSVPAHYLHQVLTGMCVIHVKYCLFAQFRFRRCAIWLDPTSPSYDRVYHKEYRRREPDKRPIAFGYLYWEGPEHIVDLSAHREILKVKPRRKPDRVIINEKFFPNTGFVLMWKLFDIRYDVITPQPDYLKDKEEMLWKKYKDLRSYLR